MVDPCLITTGCALFQREVGQLDVVHIEYNYNIIVEVHVYGQFCNMSPKVNYVHASEKQIKVLYNICYLIDFN